MGFTLFPVDETVEPLDVNYWNWRPTVALIESLELIDDERLELMQIDCCGAEVTADEAKTIADRIESGLLSRMPDDGRMTLDLGVTTQPDDFQFHTGDDVEKNYSATADWLKRFVAFCRICGGFSVI